MPKKLDAAVDKLRAIAEEQCENQMYVWPGFDPEDPDPVAFFRKRKIKFDGVLFIRYPVKATFQSLTEAQIAKEEKLLGATLPEDYKSLLQTFGEFHLPGNAMICIKSPARALQTTRGCWCTEGQPLTVLAISSYCDTSDGNSFGYIRTGDSFGPALYEFNHELWRKNAKPALWAKKLSASLADFVLEYLKKIGK